MHTSVHGSNIGLAAEKKKNDLFPFFRDPLNEEKVTLKELFLNVIKKKQSLQQQKKKIKHTWNFHFNFL